MSDITSKMDLRTYTLLRILKLVQSASEPLTANETAAIASWDGEPCLQLPSGVDEFEYMDSLADSGLLSKNHCGKFTISNLGLFYLSKLQKKLDSPNLEDEEFQSYTIA